MKTEHIVIIEIGCEYIGKTIEYYLHKNNEVIETKVINNNEKEEVFIIKNRYCDFEIPIISLKKM